MMLTFADYAEATARTAVYPRKYAAAYPLLGLLGETGELLEAVIQHVTGNASDAFVEGGDAEGVDPILRDMATASVALKRIEAWKKLARKDTLPQESANLLVNISQSMIADTAWVPELGDTLWYEDRIAADAGTSLAAIANDNAEKLRKRAVDGTLKERGPERDLDDDSGGESRGR